MIKSITAKRIYHYCTNYNVNRTLLRFYEPIASKKPVEWKPIPTTTAFSYNPKGSSINTPEPIVFLTKSKSEATKIVDKMNYPYGVVLLEINDKDSISDIISQYQEVLRTLYKERAFVVGHGIGGTIAIKAAIEDMDSVSGIVLLESNIEESINRDLPDLETLKLYQHPLAIVKYETNSNMSNDIVSHLQEHHFVKQYATISDSLESETSIVTVANTIDNFLKEFDIYQEIKATFEYYKDKAANI